MYFGKLEHDGNIIEFHNNIWGKEKVIVNGKVESEKSSVFGTYHDFNIDKNGKKVKYRLKSMIDGATMGIVVDLYCNAELVIHAEPIKMQSISYESQVYKRKGLKKLNQFDLEDAIMDFNKSLEINSSDPELHFYLACIFSLLEEKEKSLEQLKMAIDKGYANISEIMNNDKLAFIRIQSEFENFRLTYLPGN